MWQQIENMGFLNYVFSFSCWNISLEKISGLMIMEKKDLYIFLIKCFMIHTYTLIKFFFLFLAEVKHMLLREVFHVDTPLAAALYICQQNKMWKDYISIKVITFQSSLLLYTMWHYIEPRCYFLPDP